MAERAFAELCERVGVGPPAGIVWLETPWQGLLADAYLHRAQGEKLFSGDDPPIFRALMVAYLAWRKTLRDGQVFPAPAWADHALGRRLNCRAVFVKSILTQFAAELVRGKSPADADLDAVLNSLAAPMGSSRFLKILPSAMKEIGSLPRWSSPIYVSDFNFDVQRSYGDGEFTLRSPRSMNMDRIAATVYEVENMSPHLPEWFGPLSELAGAVGWVWPFEEVAVFCDRPVEAHFDYRDELHCESGPALRFADGTRYFMLEGKVVGSQVVMHPLSIKPETVAREPDLEKKRLILRRVGGGMLHDPEWPDELKQLGRMVFELQYRRFTVEDLRGRGKPWPVCEHEDRPKDLDGLEPGCYYTAYEDGQLCLVARRKADWSGPFLRLERGVAEGMVSEGAFAERYYADGRVEGFSPYDDDSPPIPTTKTFEAWVGENLKKILAG